MAEGDPEPDNPVDLPQHYVYRVDRTSTPIELECDPMSSRRRPSLMRMTLTAIRERPLQTAGILTGGAR